MHENNLQNVHILFTYAEIQEIVYSTVKTVNYSHFRYINVGPRIFIAIFTP